MGFNIAIDGPAGAGKSTIAKQVAKKLGFIYVDTGAMYRALAYYFVKAGLDYEDKEMVEREAHKAIVTLGFENGEQCVFLNGENVNAYIRTEEVSKAASKTSSYPKIRELLLNLQKDMAEKEDVVMDGRDIGTVVLPNAECKIYLTASVEERANRRYKEYIAKGENVDLEEIKTDIASRDYQDMHRDISPLKQADDAYFLDSSDMTIEQVKDRIIELSGRK